MASLISKIVAKIDYSVKMISKRRTTRLLLFVIVENHMFTFLTSELTFSWPWIEIALADDLDDDLEWQKNTINGFFHTKSHEKEVLHILTALLVQKWYIPTHLTLKLTFWPWRWPWIILLISEMGGRFLWYLYGIRNSPIQDKVQIELKIKNVILNNNRTISERRNWWYFTDSGCSHFVIYPWTTLKIKITF